MIVKRRQQQDTRIASDGDDSPADFISTLFSSGLSDEDIRDTIVTLFFAGHDNFLNVLGWTMHELGQAPHWFKHMRLESERLNPQGDVISFGDVSVRFLLSLKTFWVTHKHLPHSVEVSCPSCSIP